MTGGVIAVVAAAHARAERRHVDAFHRAGATAARHARPPGALGLARDDAFGRLAERGVLREAAAGAYYLDEAALAAHPGRPVAATRVRRRPAGAARAVIGAAVLLLLGALFAGVAAWGQAR